MKSEKSIGNSLSQSWHSKRPKKSLQGEGDSNATPFTAIASVSSNPSTLVAIAEHEEIAAVLAPMFPASPVFPAPTQPELNENQLWLHDLSFKNPPSKVVERDPTAQPEGFYFKKWLDETTKNINSK